MTGRSQIQERNWLDFTHDGAVIERPAPRLRLQAQVPLTGSVAPELPLSMRAGQRGRPIRVAPFPLQEAVHRATA